VVPNGVGNAFLTWTGRFVLDVLLCRDTNREVRMFHAHISGWEVHNKWCSRMLDYKRGGSRVGV